MIYLYKGTIPEVIDTQSKYYPFLTKELASNKKTLPPYICPLLGVIRKNGEPVFFYGSPPPSEQHYYSIDFYIPESGHRFLHITTIGKDEAHADKHALIECFDPQKQAARVRFTLDCLKKGKDNPASYWMPKVLEERVTEQNEAEYKELFSHLKEHSTDLGYIEELAQHIFSIRPNPCPDKAENFAWLGDAFLKDGKIEKAITYYKAANLAYPQSNRGRMGLAAIFYSGLTSDKSVKEAITVEETVNYIIGCLEKGKEKIATALFEELLTEPASDQIKPLLDYCKDKNSHVALAERLIHHLFPTNHVHRRDKAAYFSWLGDMLRSSDAAKAERYYLRALHLNRQASNAKLGIGILLFSGKITGFQDIETSTRIFEEVLVVKKNCKEALAYLSMIYMDQAEKGLAKLKRAKTCLKKLLKQEPNNQFITQKLVTVSSWIRTITEEQKAENAISHLDKARVADILSGLFL